MRDQNASTTNIVEIVQVLNYQVNTAGLDKATNLIKQQLSELGRLNQSLQRIEGSMKSTSSSEIDSLNKLNDSLKKVGSQLDKTAAKTKGIFSEIGKGALDGLGLKGGVAGITAQAVGMLKDLAVASVKAGAKMEQLTLKFTTLLGNGDAAKQTLAGLQDFASKSPFNLDELTTTSELLLNAGLSGNELLPTLEQLGEVAAGLGTDKLPALATGLGKIMQDGALTKDTFQELKDNGLDLLQLMADQSGQSISTLNANLAKGTIGADQIQQALAKATTEGGKFFGNIAAQNDTLDGSLGNLGDEFLEFQTILGELLEGPLKPIIELLTTILDEVNEKLPDMIASFKESEGIQTMINGIQELFNVLYEALVPIIEALLPIMDTFFQFTGKIYSAIAPLIKQIADALVPVLNILIAVLTPIIDFIADVAVAAFDGITKAVGFLINNVKEALDFIADLGKALGKLLGIDATISISTKKANDIPDTKKDTATTDNASTVTTTAADTTNTTTTTTTTDSKTTGDNKPRYPRRPKVDPKKQAEEEEKQLQKNTEKVLKAAQDQKIRLLQLEVDHQKAELKTKKHTVDEEHELQVALLANETMLKKAQAELRQKDELEEAKKIAAKADKLKLANKITKEQYIQIYTQVEALKEKHKNELTDIENDGAKQKEKIQEDYNKKKLEIIEDGYKDEFKALNKKQREERSVLLGDYQSGKISGRKYDIKKRKLDVQQKIETNTKDQGVYEQKIKDGKNNGISQDEIDKLEAKLISLKEERKTLDDEVKTLKKESLLKAIDGYQQITQAAADAYNKILEIQIQALDREISIREKRVEAARKLAERGNVDALKLEEDRLNKAQQKRAQFAKKQQALNAAITVSNAIAAVARAAAEGGGFGSAATIAALIAALAAGYAAVSGMSQSNSDAFADGVVDYKGAGGPRDDKNWVRISNGESVITADGTRKNHALLEAINNGANFNVLGLAEMPMLKTPMGVYEQSSYATTKDLNGLERKFDEVVLAIERNKFKQNIFFDEQGVGVMTEKAINKNRRRWK